jgi:hypothetical protein
VTDVPGPLGLILCSPRMLTSRWTRRDPKPSGFFEVGAPTPLSVIITGIVVVGMLERRDKTIWRAGVDSMFAIVVFVCGLVGLSSLA